VAQAVGANGILFLLSGEPRVYAGDVNYHFRQENNLYYLTNLKQKGATLVLTPGNDALPEILFLPRRIPIRETWTGHMYSVEEANQISGIKEIWEASEFEPFARALRNRQPYVPKPENILLSAAGAGTAANGAAPGATFQKLFDAASSGQARLFLLQGQQEQRFTSEWASTVPANTSPAPAASSTPAALPSSSPSQSPSARAAVSVSPAATPSGYTIENASRIFADLRLRKSPMEIALMQHAIDITTEAIERSWVAAAEAKWEYEIDAVVLYTFKLRNADHWGYPNIVGCGPNATTLHYEESQGPVGPGDIGRPGM